MATTGRQAAKFCRRERGENGKRCVMPLTYKAEFNQASRRCKLRIHSYHTGQENDLKAGSRRFFSYVAHQLHHSDSDCHKNRPEVD